MHSVLLIGSFALGVLAIPTKDRNKDTCLQALLDFPDQASPFCDKYSSVFDLGEDIFDLIKDHIDHPEWIAPCWGQPSKISSACSCFKTATSGDHHTSTTSFNPTTASIKTTTSIPSPTTSSTSSIKTTTSSLSSTTSLTSTTSSSSTTSSQSLAASSTTSTIPSTSSGTSSSTTPSQSLTVSSTTSTISSTSSGTSITLTSSSAQSSTSSATSPARTSPAAGAIIVDASNSTAGSYITVGQGVSALSLTSTTPQTLFIYPGTYVEQVYIPALKSNLTVQGYTTDATSYESNTATITYNLALLNTTSDDLTATVRQWNPNTKFYNLNIANTFGHVSHNGQNLALSAYTGNQGYYGVQLLGYQDTLLSNTGNQLYAKSLIVGAIDFIFGQTATAWFDQVDIRTIAAGSVTASGRSSASNPSWYVINNSTVDGINSTIAAGKNFLGRPWQSFARVVFQETYLGAIIAPAGWSVWSTSVNGTTNIGNVTFAEYDNYGPGSILDEGPRANFSEQLNSSIAIETILGGAWRDEWWVDLSYMPNAS